MSVPPGDQQVGPSSADRPRYVGGPATPLPNVVPPGSAMSYGQPPPPPAPYQAPIRYAQPPTYPRGPASAGMASLPGSGPALPSSWEGLATWLQRGLVVTAALSGSAALATATLLSPIISSDAPPALLLVASTFGQTAYGTYMLSGIAWLVW